MINTIILYSKCRSVSILARYDSIGSQGSLSSISFSPLFFVLGVWGGACESFVNSQFHVLINSHGATLGLIENLFPLFVCLLPCFSLRKYVFSLNIQKMNVKRTQPLNYQFYETVTFSSRD